MSSKTDEDGDGESASSTKMSLLNACVRQCKVPEEWQTGIVIPPWIWDGRATR